MPCAALKALIVLELFDSHNFVQLTKQFCRICRDHFYTFLYLCLFKTKDWSSSKNTWSRLALEQDSSRS